MVQHHFNYWEIYSPNFFPIRLKSHEILIYKIKNLKTKRQACPSILTVRVSHSATSSHQPRRACSFFFPPLTLWYPYIYTTGWSSGCARREIGGRRFESDSCHKIDGLLKLIPFIFFSAPNIIHSLIYKKHFNNRTMKMKDLLRWVLSILNIYPDKNQKWILMSQFTRGLIITYINPVIMKTLISGLPAEWIAAQNLISALAGFMIGVAWQKTIRRKAIKGFVYLAVIESTCGFLLGLYLALIQWNIWVFAICSLIYSTLVVQFVSKCVMAFRSTLWKEREREIYDNNNSIVGGIVCIVGFAFALILMPSLKFALILWSIGCIVDDLGWIIVYIKNKDQLRGEEEK